MIDPTAHCIFSGGIRAQAFDWWWAAMASHTTRANRGQLLLALDQHLNPPGPPPTPAPPRVPKPPCSP